MNTLQKVSLIVSLVLSVFTLYTYANSEYGFFFHDNVYNDIDIDKYQIYYADDSLVYGRRLIESFWVAIQKHFTGYHVFYRKYHWDRDQNKDVFSEPKYYREDLHYLLLLIGLTVISFFSIRLFKDKD